jgi:hypothetical protein
MSPVLFQFGSDIEALERLIPLNHRRIVHVGCGKAKLSWRWRNAAHR